MNVNIGRVAVVTLAASVFTLPGVAALTLTLADDTPPRIIVVDPAGLEQPAPRPIPTLGA